MMYVGATTRGVGAGASTWGVGAVRENGITSNTSHRRCYQHHVCS